MFEAFPNISILQPKMKKLLIGLSSLSILYSCQSNSSDIDKADIKSYPVVTVSTKDTALELSYVANIQARKNVEIRSRVSGILEKIHVDEGQNVKQGQLLFSINDDELQIALSKTNAALNSAIADAKVASVEVERVKLLVEKKIVSNTELDLAEAKHNAANAKIEEARAAKASVLKQLSYTRIFAPFEGVIDRLPLKSGSILSDGSLLTTLSDIHSMLAYFHISENEYLHLIQTNHDDSIGLQEVSLTLANGALYKHKGRVEASESEINENTGSIAFRADFPNPEKILRHGASARLVIQKPSSRVLLIPQKSVVEIQDKYYVYTVDQNNIVKMKNFKPLQRLKDFYIVKEGIVANERIILEGIQSVRDGEKIKPTKP